MPLIISSKVMYAVLCPPEGFGAGLGCGLVGIDLEGLLIALEVLVGALEGVPDLTCTFVDTLDFVLGFGVLTEALFFLTGGAAFLRSAGFLPSVVESSVESSFLISTPF